jgi:hypothetical protein
MTLFDMHQLSVGLNHHRAYLECCFRINQGAVNFAVMSTKNKIMDSTFIGHFRLYTDVFLVEGKWFIFNFDVYLG